MKKLVKHSSLITNTTYMYKDKDVTWVKSAFRLFTTLHPLITPVTHGLSFD
ncbi:MAG: hypothetical protein KBT29_08310 [Prevotellaceae bacterium]|nr:hypothetical protein [Candidatus Minthosoma caballi]